MGQAYRTQRRVEFRDTDAAGIVHFSVFFTYMEQAEHAFLRHLGLTVMPPPSAAAPALSWPRVSATCDYRVPIRFEDCVDIDVEVESIGNKSVTYTFEFCRDQDIVAQGRIVTVSCEISAGKPPVSVPVPDSVRNLLSPYLR